MPPETGFSPGGSAPAYLTGVCHIIRYRARIDSAELLRLGCLLNWQGLFVVEFQVLYNDRC